MNIIPFEAHHVSLMTPQSAQAFEVDYAPVEAATGQAWTAVVDGLPVACSGLIELWKNRAQAWALLSADAGPYMLPITREIRFRLASSSFRRIEMAVDVGFDAGIRWAHMLGYEHEATVRCYFPDGRGARLYARIM
jgi:hypothetical protein